MQRKPSEYEKKYLVEIEKEQLTNAAYYIIVTMISAILLSAGLLVMSYIVSYTNVNISTSDFNVIIRAIIATTLIAVCFIVIVLVPKSLLQLYRYKTKDFTISSNNDIRNCSDAKKFVTFM